MSLATTLMAVGLPAEQANRLGYEDRVPLDGNGTTQGSATELMPTQTNVALGTSVGDAAFRLPAEAEYFQEYFLLNTTAETALIFPPVGDTIDANALNASVGIDTDLARVFMRVEEGRWVSMPSGEGGGGIESIVAGTGISVDNTDPDNPVVSNDGVLSVSGGAGISVDITDPQNPVVINAGVVSVTAGSNVSITGTPENPIISATGGGSGTVDSVVAGTGIDVDATDPANPIVALEPAADVRNYLDTPVYVADRTALAALDTTKDTVAWLKEAGRERMFQWDGSDLSSTLVINSQTTTAVDAGTETLTKAAHGYLAGEALVPTASVNGLTAGTIYYAIRVDANTFRLASTWANAMAGTPPVNLTGTTNVTFQKLLDPRQGIYVTGTGAPLSGTGGAWVAQDQVLVADFWGAKHDGVTDDTQAMNAAVLYTSVRGDTLNLLPGTYFINTQTASSYAARAIGNYNITIQGQDGWRIIGSGTDKTVFTTGTSGNYSHIFFIMDCAGFEFAQIGFVGNNTGLGGSDNNGAVFPYCINEFWFHDISTSVFQGSHFVGNFWFNGDFERIYQNIPANASGYDCASIQNVVIDGQTAVGAGTGSGQGFQHSFDSPNNNPAFNTTGVTLRDDVSNTFWVQNGSYEGFATGVAIFEARDFWITGNLFTDNYKATGDSIYGALIGPTNTAVMWNATVTENIFTGNGTPSGTAGLRAGLLVNSNVAAVHALIAGNKFYDNAPAGISFFGANCNVKQLYTNSFGNISTSDQTSNWVGNPLIEAQTVEVADAVTNAVSVAQTLRHTTSGTATTGIGVGQNFEIETAAGNVRVGARVAASANSAVDGAENIALDFSLMKAGAAVQRFFRMQPAGLFLIGDTGIAGVDFGVNLQSGFPQSWQYSVSAANGNLYFFDNTNGKFPITFAPNSPDGSLTLSATTGVGSTQAIRSSGATQGVGYATGAGGAVTQATSKATGVTLNKVCGQITTNNAALAANTTVIFTVTDSAVVATDVVRVTIGSGGTAGAYLVWVTATAAGSFNVAIRNITAGSLSESLVLNFAVEKAVAA